MVSKVFVYKSTDLKKDGSFKKKNNVREMSVEEFKKYILENNKTVSKPYIDSYGLINDGEEFFMIEYRGMIVGVTSVIREIALERSKKQLRYVGKNSYDEEMYEDEQGIRYTENELLGNIMKTT